MRLCCRRTRQLVFSSDAFYSMQLALLPSSKNCSLFTSAAALASAICAVGLDRSSACEGSSAPTKPTALRFGGSRTATTGPAADGRSAQIPSASSPQAGSRIYPTSVVAFKGQRSYMEDDFFISKDGTFAAVYDGHGGAGVAKYLSNNLHAQMLAALPDQDATKVSHEDLTKALLKAFKIVDEGVMRVNHWKFMGSTAVVVVLHRDPGATQVNLISANVGDSRAVLSREGKAVDLTVDHKPNLASEMTRIKKLNGKVTWYGLHEQSGEPLEGLGVWRINGNLAVARAIGDREERPFVSGEVDTRKVAIEKGDDFIILASDGLWDVMSSEQAVNFVHSVMSAQIGAMIEGSGDGETYSGDRPVDVHMTDWSERYADDRGIIRAAMMTRKKKMARYLSEEAFRRGTMDNVTCIVVWLK